MDTYFKNIEKIKNHPDYDKAFQLMENGDIEGYAKIVNNMINDPLFKEIEKQQQKIFEKNSELRKELGIDIIGKDETNISGSHKQNSYSNCTILHPWKFKMVSQIPYFDYFI
jgi:hypothetical protein